MYGGEIRKQELVCGQLPENRHVPPHGQSCAGCEERNRHGRCVPKRGLSADSRRLEAAAVIAETRTMSKRYSSAAEFDVTLLLELLG